MDPRPFSPDLVGPLLPATADRALALLNKLLRNTELRAMGKGDREWVLETYSYLAPLARFA